MIYGFDGYEVDLDSHTVRHDGERLPVEPQVFDVIALLLRHRARTVTKEELLDEVWGNRFVSESALTSRIKAARRVLGDDGRTQSVIRTVHGRGYQFVATVTPTSTVTAATVSAPVQPGPPGAARPVGAVPVTPRTRYARSGECSIAYQVVGDGDEDMVFVSGFVSNLDLQWEFPPMADFFVRLAEGRRLIVFDKRGTGLSDRVPLDRLPTLEERMDDVRAVMDAAGSQRASLFGISEGGPMSVLFAASHPERVARMALFGTYAHAPFDDVAGMTTLLRRWWGSGTNFEVLAPSWAADPTTRRFLARYERASATPETAAALVELSNEIDVRPALSAVSAPTLVVHRTGDEVVRVDRARELAAGIRDAVLVEHECVDHLVFADHEPVIDAVRSFFDGSDPATAAPDRILTTLLSIRVDEKSTDEGSAGEQSAGVLDRTLVEACLDEVGASAPAGRSRSAHTPDGLLAMVDGPVRAIRGAQRLVGPGGRLGPGARAAVHTSEVELVGGSGPSGPGVQITAAASELAEPGEVLVTRTVRDLIVGSGIEFSYRGAFPLSGSLDRWELYAPVPG